VQPLWAADNSLVDVQKDFETLREQITQAFSELRKTEQTMKSCRQRRCLAERSEDQAISDEIGLQLHRRKV